jgi:phosphopantothenoylcysteine decarboxylase / phosphopantothenate---cysteine ligase
MEAQLSGKTIVLGVTGGIAAYKAAELGRLLVKAGAQVHVVMTEAACRFITPLTLQALSGHEVAHDMFEPGRESKIGHIELASTADLVIIAPATADAIARFAAGMANDLVAAVVLATRAPILLAPAMNTNMWENRITQENLARLCRDGRVATVGPDAGELACGWVGAGRMVNPEEIVAAAVRRLEIASPEMPSRDGEAGLCPAEPERGRVWEPAQGSYVSRDGEAGLCPAEPERGRVWEPAQGSHVIALAGRRVVVTAGPTWEAVDDVRFLGNRSSGKMGFALAAVAAELGADVVLVAGPVALATPAGVAKRLDVESALEMREALNKAAAQADVVVMAAAVADFRPGVRVLGKLSRRDTTSRAPAAAREIPLVQNPDLLAELGRLRQGGRPYLVGFAAEVGLSSQALVERARAKLAEKLCDVVVANEVGRPGTGFGADDNAVTLVFADGRTIELPAARKDQLARAIWDKLCPELADPARSAALPNPERKPDGKRHRRSKGKNA